MRWLPSALARIAISKELGLPLRFPGKPGAYAAIYQLTDSSLLAKAMTWCATSRAAHNDVFNVTNGDFFRWANLWPRIPEAFEMPWAPLQTIRLTEFMADKGPLWAHMRDRYGLKPYAYEQPAAWPFADYVWGSDWDVMSDTLKIRRAGFHQYEDSEAMVVRLMREFRAAKIVRDADLMRGHREQAAAAGYGRRGSRDLAAGYPDTKMLHIPAQEVAAKRAGAGRRYAPCLALRSIERGSCRKPFNPCLYHVTGRRDQVVNGGTN